MTPAESHYEDMLIRWLTVRRDTPEIRGYEPDFPEEAYKTKATSDAFWKLRARIIRDFERTK